MPAHGLLAGEPERRTGAGDHVPEELNVYNYIRVTCIHMYIYIYDYHVVYLTALGRNLSLYIYFYLSLSLYIYIYIITYDVLRSSEPAYALTPWDPWSFHSVQAATAISITITVTITITITSITFTVIHLVIAITQHN